MSVTLTIQDIVTLCDFAGIHVDHNKSVFNGDEEQLETELTIEQNTKVQLDDNSVYEGLAAHFTEYPEEGSMPLNAINENSVKMRVLS